MVDFIVCFIDVDFIIWVFWLSCWAAAAIVKRKPASNVAMVLFILPPSGLRAGHHAGMAAAFSRIRMHANRKMIKVLLSLFLMSIAAPAFSQAVISKGLSVNGVKLGASYQSVVTKFGKPVNDVTDRKINECTGTRLRTITYPGLKVELDDGSGKFTVFGYEITSARYDVSGVKVGDPAAAVLKLFGTRGRTVEKQKGGEVWFYEMSEENPGGSSFYFTSGRLTKMQTTYQMC